MSNTANNTSEFIKKLEKNISHYKKGATTIFLMDKENKKKDGKQEKIRGELSIEEYVGMENWPVCDYLIIKGDKTNTLNIFLVEKTDLLLSVKDKKISDKSKYTFLKNSIKSGLKHCGCQEKQQEQIKDEILKKYRTEIIDRELSNENLGKLYSSLHMLHRLHEENNYKGIWKTNHAFHFILWDAPTPEMDRSSEHDIAAVSEEMFTKINSNIKSNIGNRGSSKENSDKAIKVSFGEILQGKDENIDTVLKHNNNKTLL